MSYPPRGEIPPYTICQCWRADHTAQSHGKTPILASLSQRDHAHDMPGANLGAGIGADKKVARCVGLQRVMGLRSQLSNVNQPTIQLSGRAQPTVPCGKAPPIWRPRSYGPKTKFAESDAEWVWEGSPTRRGGCCKVSWSAGPDIEWMLSVFLSVVHTPRQ